MDTDKLNRQEIARYLGIKGERPDERTSALVEEMINEISHLATPRYTARVLEILQTPEGVVLNPGGLCLNSAQLKALLKHSSQGVLFAATLGVGVERRIRLYGTSDVLKSLVLDCVASEYIEKYCDEIQQEFAEQYAPKGLYVTRRFSPGYGDLPLSVQADCLRMLDAHRKIGLGLTPEYIMTPHKSVTALFGLSAREDKTLGLPKCAFCSMRENCAVRKAGAYCGR